VVAVAKPVLRNEGSSELVSKCRGEAAEADHDTGEFEEGQVHPSGAFVPDLQLSKIVASPLYKSMTIRSWSTATRLLNILKDMDTSKGVQTMKITHVNPDGLHKNPAFSQAVVAEGGKTIYIGGQNGVLPDGTIVGDTLAAQTGQAYKNLLEILRTVGASQENVVKLTVYVVKGQDIQEGLAASQQAWGNFPTALTFAFVEELGVPGALVEIDAIAVVDG
jgi:enamine deaminase RidA (YjgF/YER057c/UK114 family)